jgi:hypothetical protein
MVLYPVPRPGDMIGRGLVRKTGLINPRYSIASAYQLCDNEPQFLSLNVFALHKDKG